MSLIDIQRELRVPKSQLNKFGGYNYRNCEDILEAVKPLLTKYKCELIVWDDVVPVEGRVYVRANAKLIDAKGKNYDVSAYAREPENKKGMDESQITGAASSYARKYALSGLFLLDDNKDADSQPEPEAKPKRKQTLKAGTETFDKAKEWLMKQTNKALALEKMETKYKISKAVEAALLSEGTEID